MDDDCWKSTAVVDRDMMEETVERAQYIEFDEGTPLGERLLTAAEQGCSSLVQEILSQHCHIADTAVTDITTSLADTSVTTAADTNTADTDIATSADIDTGSVVNYQDSDGYTALHRACYQGWSDIVDIIIRHGGDVSSRTEDGWTPLHSAARWNKVECAKLLIAAGCDVNAQSNGKQTPLHIASSSQACLEVIQLLLWHPDTDVTLVNNSGDTAEKVASSNSRLAPLFEMKHKFVDINPLLDKEVFYQ